MRGVRGRATVRAGGWVLLVLGGLALMLGVVRAVWQAPGLTPDWGRTPTEARAMEEAEKQLPAAYTLRPDELARAHRKARIETALHFGREAWAPLQLWLLLSIGGVASMQRVALGTGRRRWLQGLVFLGVLLAGMTALDLPLDVVGHWVSRRYGLSVQGWGSWAWDQGKGVLLSWGIGWPILLLLVVLMRRSPTRWWLGFWAVLVPMVLLGTFLLPVVIEPMFDHFEPLSRSEPALVRELERVAAKGGVGIPPERMFLMRASDKVTGLNAYVTGIGRSKRVVIWDTTLRKATPEEILFIAGHEMGHYALGHIVRGLALAMGGLLVTFRLGFLFVRWAVGRYGSRWGIGSEADWGTSVVLLLAMSILSIVSEPVASTLSRVEEHQADVFGQEVVHGIVGDPRAVGRAAFQLLGETGLDEPMPSPLLEFWTYGHPSISCRAAFAAVYDPWVPGEEPRYVGR